MQPCQHVENLGKNGPQLDLVLRSDALSARERDGWKSLDHGYDICDTPHIPIGGASMGGTVTKLNLLALRCSNYGMAAWLVPYKQIPCLE